MFELQNPTRGVATVLTSVVVFGLNDKHQLWHVFHKTYNALPIKQKRTINLNLLVDGTSVSSAFCSITLFWSVKSLWHFLCTRTVLIGVTLNAYTVR